MTDIAEYPQRRRWLLPAALVFIVLVFGSHYARLPIGGVYRALWTLSTPRWLRGLFEAPLRGFYIGLWWFDLLFFSRVASYLALSAAGLGLAVAALIWSRPGKLGSGLLVVSLVAILALPAIYRYEPAVTVDPTMARVRVPTQPGPIRGVVKTMQAGMEIRRCDYRLLGWSEQDALYGEETCGERRRTWVVWPMSDARLETVEAVPDDLLREEVSRDALRAAGVRSTIPQDEPLRLAVREPGLASPTGWWVAFIARHTYGPEDVVVLMR